MCVTVWLTEWHWASVDMYVIQSDNTEPAISTEFTSPIWSETLLQNSTATICHIWPADVAKFNCIKWYEILNLFKKTCFRWIQWFRKVSHMFGTLCELSSLSELFEGRRGLETESQSLFFPLPLLIPQVMAIFPNERLRIVIPITFPIWRNSHRTGFQALRGNSGNSWVFYW